MKQNKIFAVKRFKEEWWSVIDCGESKEGGMTTGNFFTNHFKKDGRTYRWYAQLFMPPNGLTEWQEINTIDKMVTVVDVNGNAFEGWEDEEDKAYEILQSFAKLIGKELTIEEVKSLITKTTP